MEIRRSAFKWQINILNNVNSNNEKPTNSMYGLPKVSLKSGNKRRGCLNKVSLEKYVSQVLEVLEHIPKNGNDQII